MKNAPIQVNTSILGLIDGTEIWRPLPAWARFHLETGLAIGRLGETAERRILAIAVPARDYAAVLCAGGAVLAAYERESALDVEEKFCQLSQLPVGAALTLLEGSRSKRGELIGTEFGYTGEPHLRIRTEAGAGGTIEVVPRHRIWRVGVAAPGSVRLPKRQRGRRLQQVNRFAEDVLAPLDPLRFTEPGHVGCLIVGSKTGIEEDAMQSGFATYSHDQNLAPAQGCLNEILRLGGTPGASGAYRTDVLSVYAGGIAESSRMLPIVVFDGAAAYLKWRNRIRSARVIVVLDRTESRFERAVKQLHRDYVRRSQTDLDWEVPCPPSGVEALRFNQKIR